MLLRHALASGLLVALLFSACTDDAGQARTDPSGLHDDGTGSIVGTVTDDSLAPLPGATVSLDGQMIAATDEAGTFTFDHVAPGEHALAASHPGFQDAVRLVRVEAGATVRTALALPHVAGQEPYYETRLGEGLIGCGVSVRHPASSFPIGVAACGVFAIAGVTSIDRWRTDWNVGPLDNSSGAFMETRGIPNQASAAAMIVQWATTLPDTRVQTYNSTTGKSPLRIRVPIEEIRNVTAKADPKTCTMEKCAWNAYHFAWAGTFGPSAAADVTVLVQQRFTDYLTFFYNQPLPQDFSAVRDG